MSKIDTENGCPLKMLIFDKNMILRKDFLLLTDPKHMGYK